MSPVFPSAPDPGTAATSTGQGTLVLIGTPLGNRQDWSPRARHALLRADLLLCEDTRSPQRLVDEGESLPPRLSCFAHNEAQRVDLLLEHLAAGKTVAFVSEAGMPVISDPGQLLVDAVWRAGYRIDCIPGPCAATTALCLSGFPAQGSRFLGFVARHGQEREALLRTLVHESAACVFYEAGNRVRDLIRDIHAALPDTSTRRLLVARELTKVHQELQRGSIDQLTQVEIDTRGEFTLVLEGSLMPIPALDPVTHRREGAQQAMALLLDSTLKPREKARSLAQLCDGDARQIYAALFEKKDQG